MSILSRLCRSGENCVFDHFVLHSPKFHARTIFFLVLFPTRKILVWIEQSTLHPLVLCILVFAVLSSSCVLYCQCLQSCRPLVLCIASFHSLVIPSCSVLPVFIVLSSPRVLYCQCLQSCHPLVFCIASVCSLVILSCSVLPVFIVLSSPRVLYCEFS